MRVLKDTLVELAFILDRSGSMAGLESDTIGGFNSMLNKQRNEPGEALVTTVLFDHDCELLHERLDIRKVQELTGHDYWVRGSTALLDAVGATITKLKHAQDSMPEAERPGKTMLVIITDGLENASREYSRADIKRLIERQQSGDGWELIFLGANMDAVAEARQIGIRAERAATFSNDRVGTRLNYAAVSKAISSVRANANLDESWKADIEGNSAKEPDARGKLLKRPRSFL